MTQFFSASKKLILASKSPRRQQFLRDLGIDFYLPSQVKEILDATIESNTKNISINQNIVNSHLQAVNQVGVLAKDDTEARPTQGEVPKDYVLRMVIEKMLQELTSFGIVKPEEDKGIDFTVFAKELQEHSQTISELSFPLCLVNMQNLASNNTDVDIQSDFIKNSVFITADTIVAFGNEILGKPQDEDDALSMLTKLSGNSHTVLTAVSMYHVEQKQLFLFCDTAEVCFAPWPQDLLKAYVRSKDCMDKAGSYGIQGIGMFLSNGIKGAWDTVAGLPVAKLLETLLYTKSIEISTI